MSTNFGKAAIIVAMLLAIGCVFYLKDRRHRIPKEQVHGNPRIVATAQNPSANHTPTAATQVSDTEKPSTASQPIPGRKPNEKAAKTAAVTSKTPAPVKAVPAKTQLTVRLPRLLELGSDSCRPCQMMKPVLASLREEYAGKLQVDFIDVWKDTAAGEKYHVQGIPTQIFFDSSGKEVFRHTGYYPKEDILAKFKESGIPL